MLTTVPPPLRPRPVGRRERIENICLASIALGSLAGIALIWWLG